MSIVKVSELAQTNNVTTGSLFYVAYGDGPIRESKHITEEDLFNQYATTGSNNFVGDQNITGSLYIDTTPLGSTNDLAVVINPTTNLVSYVPQTLRTSYGLFTQTSDSNNITATTNESNINSVGVGSLEIPANGFAIGDSFRVDMGGIISCVNNETLRIRIKTTSGIILADSETQQLDAITQSVWTLSINFTVRNIGIAGVASMVSLGSFTYNAKSHSPTRGFAFNTVNQTTFNTVSSNTLIVTVEWGSNNGGNSIYSDIFTLNKIY